MNELTKPQLVLLVVLVSFVTSLTTVVVTVSVLESAPQPEPRTLLQRVIEKAKEGSGMMSGGGEKEQNAPVVVQEEDLITAVVEHASPAVVSIVAAKDLPIVERYSIDPFFGGDEFFRQFFGVPQEENRGSGGASQRQEIGRGTGFLVSPDGYIITNRHVVSDPDAEYTVILNSGKTYIAAVLARDLVNDISIIKIEEKQLPFVVLGDSGLIKIGQTVIAIGNALGEFDNTVSVGVISGKGRSLVASGENGGTSELQHVFQTDAAINPGNSGGPLLNTKGEVIGINTAIVSGAENIGFAIPSVIAKRAWEQVRDHGKITYPFLGVRYIVITDALQKAKNLLSSEGVLVAGSEDGKNPAVIPHSPAEAAGIREGDIILKVDNTTLNKDYSLAEYIQMKNIGDTVVLTVRRDGKDIMVSAVLKERP